MHSSPRRASHHIAEGDSAVREAENYCEHFRPFLFIPPPHSRLSNSLSHLNSVVLTSREPQKITTTSS